MKDYMNFLTLAESLNTKYASIYFNCELESLTMPFWSWSEIQAGLEQRKEWEVSKMLIPFYGDWHDLFCLDGKSGVIVALNDKREVLCSWSSINEFLSCLSEEEVVYGDMQGVVQHFDETKGREMKH